MLIRKKQIDQIRVSELFEPDLNDDELAFLGRGVKLFNEGRFWEAHEAWEELWKQRGEESRIFFQGIIQAAAGFHRIFEKALLGGATKNLEKALAKLRLFPSMFLGIDVEKLRRTIVRTQGGLASSGLGGGKAAGRPTMIYRRPGDQR